MPNRVIRESLLDSSRYEALTVEAKLLFFHLLLLADDFGCVRISEPFLRRRAMADIAILAKLLGELLDVDLIRTYESERSTYAFIPRFRQRLQRSTLKHPAPPKTLVENDDDALQKFNQINWGFTKSTVGQQIGNRSPTYEEKGREEKRREEKRSEAPTAPPREWWKTEAGINLKALSLNIKPLHGETYYDLKQRLFQIIDEQKTEKR